MLKKSHLIPYIIKNPKNQENIVSYIKKITKNKIISLKKQLSTYKFDYIYTIDKNYSVSYYEAVNFFNYKKKCNYLTLNITHKPSIGIKKIQNLDAYLGVKKKYIYFLKFKKKNLKINTCF